MEFLTLAPGSDRIPVELFQILKEEEKGTTEDEMIGWRHQLDEHGFEWTLGVGDGQGDLACCGSWGRKELDMTERMK